MIQLLSYSSKAIVSTFLTKVENESSAEKSVYLCNLPYIVGDNAPVHTPLSNLLAIPFIGCASHRFNLACKAYLEQYERSLSKIANLMVSLRNVKQAGKLRTKTPLCAVLRNDTRWSSTCAMLKRFFEIKDFIDGLGIGTCESTGDNGRPRRV